MAVYGQQYDKPGAGDWFSQNQPPIGVQGENGIGTPSINGGSLSDLGKQKPGGGSLEELLRGVNPNDWINGLKQIEPQLNALGYQLQKDSAGNIRGRIYGSNLQNGFLDPFQQYGWNTSNTGGAGGGGQFGGQIDALRNTPGYQFAFGEGQRAIQNSAASKGTLLTGGTLRALTKFGTGVADQTYNQGVRNLLDFANLGKPQ